jgi:hypothetical protein
MSLVKGKKRTLKYEVHLVTYLDILGFRDLVAEASPNFISRAIRLILEATEPDSTSKRNFKENYVNFSDLIVHTVPVYSRMNQKHRVGLVFDRVHSLFHAQSKLIQEGLLIRGALTLGGMERSYGALFGPGLILAYDLERQEAKFPRIILDPALLREFETNPILRRHKYPEEMEYLSSFITEDSDGFTFIDYLKGMQTELDTSEFIEFLECHKALVEKGLTEFGDKNKSVLAKYEWLQKYHNLAAATYLQPVVQDRYMVKTPEDE